jgi:Concanavalin A-like lectin/glucanases superfamily
LQPTTALSISAWIKGDSWPNSAKVILRKGGNNPNNYQLAVYNGKVSLVLDGSDGTGIVGTTTLATGVWYYVVATWDGTTAKIYVNSALDNSPGTVRTGTIGFDTQSVYLGGRPSGGSANSFDGALDDIRIFNYALEPWEVTNLNYVGQKRGVRVLTWTEVQ